MWKCLEGRPCATTPLQLHAGIAACTTELAWLRLHAPQEMSDWVCPPAVSMPCTWHASACREYACWMGCKVGLHLAPVSNMHQVWGMEAELCLRQFAGCSAAAQQCCSKLD